MQRFAREVQRKFRVTQKTFVMLKCEEWWTSSAVRIFKELNLQFQGQWEINNWQEAQREA